MYQELENQLNRMTKEGRAERLDNRMTIRKELSSVSKRLLGVPYYVAIVRLNNGLLDGYGTLNQKEIASFFEDNTKGQYNNKMISSDIRKAVQHFELRDIINDITVKPLNKDPKSIKKTKIGDIEKCVFCNKTYKTASDSLVACRKCMGITEPPKTKKHCLKCGKRFNPSPTHWAVCMDCTQLNKRESDERYYIPKL